MRRPLEQNVCGPEQVNEQPQALAPRVDPEDCPHVRANLYFCPDCGLEFLTELFDCREE